MQIPIEDLSKKILSKQIDKQDAMRLFQSLDKESQAQVLAIFRRAEALGHAADGNRADRRLRAIDHCDLTDEHRTWIGSLVEKQDRLLQKSKHDILEYRGHCVDHRRAIHLAKDLKALHVQITHARADGACVQDIDGNRYIDISGNMGANLFGHRAPFVIDAIKQCLDDGFGLTGHSEMTFRASRLFCEATGHERVLFTQSRSDAVVVAVGVARAATGRKKVAVFAGSRHGLFGVGAASKTHPGSVPLQIGVMQAFSDELLVLDYAENTSLDTIEQLAGDIAAVLVDPVQTEHTRGKSIEFLKALRQLTIEKQIPLIFDETVAGFRVCPKGAQGLFGIQADMAIYGATPGGGLPMGGVAGAAKYMDLVDGGISRFDGDSMQNANRLGMAVAQSQDSMSMSAAIAVLGEIAARCGDGMLTCADCTCFQRTLNDKAAHLASTLNGFFAEERLPIAIETFGSLFRFRFTDNDQSISEALFFAQLRMEGVEASMEGDCFLTTAHSDEDIEAVIAAVKSSMSILKRNGFFIEAEPLPVQVVATTPEPAAAVPQEPSGQASPRREIERLRALLAADLALAEESGNS